VGDKLVAQVIGVRYELNDDFISTIGNLTKPTDEDEDNDK